MFGALGDVMSFQAVDAVGSIEQPEAGSLSIDDVESDEGVAAKKVLFGFRLWCVVELHAALEAGIPVVIRAGKAAREGDAVKFDTEGAVRMLQNLSNMIDVERAECAVRADYDREMGAVHDGEKWCARSHDMIVALAEGAELSVADCWRPDVDVPTADVIAYLRALAVLNYHAPLTAHTPLWAASFNGLVDAVVLLLESRANVDEPATSGTTPLMEAARGGHVDAIRMLLAYGADPCRLNRFGVSALGNIEPPARSV